MPDRLSHRSTLLLVTLAFGLSVAFSAPLGGGSSAAQPAAKQSAPRVVTNAPGAEPDLSLAATGTVPGLRDPRKRRPAARKKKPSVRKVVKAAPEVAPSVTPAPSVIPTPTATPRYIPPAPRHSTPKPKPKRKPAPTSTPQTSGEFDNSGES